MFIPIMIVRQSVSLSIRCLSVFVLVVTTIHQLIDAEDEMNDKIESIIYIYNMHSPNCCVTVFNAFLFQSVCG